MRKARVQLDEDELEKLHGHVEHCLGSIDDEIDADEYRWWRRFERKIAAALQRARGDR